MPSSRNIQDGGSGAVETTKVSSRAFYQEYYGHPVRHLQQLLPELRASSDRLIWTAGDSSLDNKYWFPEKSPAVGAYQHVLEPAVSKQDVTYWLNYHCQNSSNRHRTSAINTAVEATTLNERTFRLRPQDVFLRDHIQSNDILVVSVGGNDIALVPCPCTIASILGLLFCLPGSCIEKGSTCCAVPIDDCCCGCGPSLCSCAGGCPPCLGYFRHMFGTRMQKYIEALTAKTKPAKILVCMIYYPDEANVPSWAGAALAALGYNNNPSKVQALTRKIYQEATTKIKVPGCDPIVPVPLFQVLDGKNTQDYVARVEPSATGGSKIAEFILDVIDDSFANSAASSLVASAAPTSVLIHERG